MIKIEGLFKTQKFEKGWLNLTNNSKSNGYVDAAWYQMYLSDKVKDMFPIEAKDKINKKEKVYLQIKGYLSVKQTRQFTNLIIVPSEITISDKSVTTITNLSDNEENLPFEA